MKYFIFIDEIILKILNYCFKIYLPLCKGGVFLEAKLLADHLERAASLYPEKEALVYNDKKITYSQLLHATKNLAKSFLNMGIKKGDRIAVLMPNSPEYIYTYMASSLTGAILVGINPSYKGPEIAYILHNSRPRILCIIDHFRQVDYQKVIREHIFTDIIPYIIINNTRQSKKKIIRKAIIFENMLKDGEFINDDLLRKRKEILTPEDDALVIYTSGTTGKPKGAVLTHKNINTTIGAEVREWEITFRDRMLLHLPMSHIGGAAEVFIAGLMAGATLIIMDHFNPVEALKLIEKEKITFLGQVPTMFAMMFGVPDFNKYDLSSVRMCAVAGAPTPPEVMVKMFGIGHGIVRTGYGLAETAGLVTYTSKRDPREKMTTTVGKPVPEFSLKIVDDNRKELPPGEIGEVAIRGDGVFKEYYELPAETEAVIDKDGWFYTGDIGLIDDTGYLILKGRKKDMIITGGFTVFPQEVEDRLNRHPYIQMAAVCGVPDPVLGEVGRAFIVPKEGKVLKQGDIVLYLQKYLADFKIPRQYTFRDSLPLTPTGKVEKKALQEEIANQG